MKYKESLKVEIGDRLIAMYNTSQWNKGDKVIVIEKQPEYNKCTGGRIWNETKKIEQGCNMQSFYYV